MLLYFDAHWATKVGNGNAIIDIERVAMLLLLGSKSSKNYKVTTFNDILTTLYTLPPYYSNLSIANRVVNMQGENEQLKKTKTKKQTKGDKLFLQTRFCRQARVLEVCGPPR